MFACSVALALPSSALGQASEPEAAPVRSLVVRPFAGVGITSRAFERPSADGMQALSTDFVPAVEIGIDVEGWRGASLSLGVSLRYQTSVGLVVTETPPFALDNPLSVRSERIELSVTPSLRLSETRNPSRIGLALGATARTLWPGEHTETVPGYSLIGPHARLELDLPLADICTIRIAPEAQWIVAMDAVLRRMGVGPFGFAWGGEASLTFALGATWLVGVHYRESHAVASQSFEDVERYVTVRAEGGF